MGFLNHHDALPDYHSQFTFGYQIRFRSISSGIKNVQKYRVVLGVLERSRFQLCSHGFVTVSANCENCSGTNVLLVLLPG